MREILFKAKRVDSGEWVEGDLIETLPRTDLTVQAWIKPRSLLGLGVVSTLTEFFIEVDPATVCQYSEFTTLGKKIKIFEDDMWELHFYSQLAHGYVHNSGVIKRQKNGRWVCQEHSGLNIFELMDMVEVYKGGFEIVGSIHDKKEGE